MTYQQMIGQNLYSLGDSGPVVTEVQLALRDRGYALKGTGYFGNATDVAVEAYQRRMGLGVDGVVGPQFAKSLDATKGAPLPAPQREIGRPLWLEAGIRLIGTKEVAGSKNNDAIINWAKEEGGAVAKQYTADATAWCALFQNHILTKVGLKGTETLWALDFAGKWPSVKLPGPAVGAIAPMLRDGGGHVICIVGKDQHGNIMGLGGNQSDAVSIIPFPVSRLNKGFWWPLSVAAPKTFGMAALPLVSSNGKVSTKES